MLYDLNTGFPDLKVVPHQHLTEIMQESAYHPEAQQYTGSMFGLQSTREQLARFLHNQLGAEISPSELLIPHGALGGIDLTARTLLKPGRGDIVLVEDPTFFYAIHILRNNGAEVIGIPMTNDGMDMDALRQTLNHYTGRVRLMYAIPAYQNPTGMCWSVEKRAQLVELAREHDFIVLEDVTYQSLYFDAPPPPVIRSFDEAGRGDRVITLGSFSKIIMPSLRQGWLWASESQIKMLARCKTDGASGALTSFVLGEFLKAGLIDQQIENVRSLYERKRTRMAEALRKHFPDWAQWERPDGGFFFWVTLPEHIEAKALRVSANAVGVDFMPGSACFVDGQTDHHLRLCFAMLEEDQVESGVAALGKCLSTFATNG